MAFTPLEKSNVPTIHWCVLFRHAILRISTGIWHSLNKNTITQEHKILHHKDSHLKLADTVSITFEFQKKDTRNDTITHFR
jgi:hypothetical protein